MGGGTGRSARQEARTWAGIPPPCSRTLYLYSNSEMHMPASDKAISRVHMWAASELSLRAAAEVSLPVHQDRKAWDCKCLNHGYPNVTSSILFCEIFVALV